VFKIVKVHRTNLVTYLLEAYRGKSIVGAFYELHRVSHLDIYLVEKNIVWEGKGGLRK